MEGSLCHRTNEEWSEGSLGGAVLPLHMWVLGTELGLSGMAAGTRSAILSAPISCCFKSSSVAFLVLMLATGMSDSIIQGLVYGHPL